MSPQPGTIETIVEAGAVSLPVAPGVTDDGGRFVLGNVPLAPGSNRVVVRVTDARGNRSIAADTWIDRATIPAAPMGVNAAAVDRLVTINWSANSEAGLLGYRVLRNGNPLAFAWCAARRDRDFRPVHDRAMIAARQVGSAAHE